MSATPASICSTNSGAVVERASIGREVDERLGEPLVAADVLRAVEFVAEHATRRPRRSRRRSSCASSIVVPGGNSAVTTMPDRRPCPAGKMLNPSAAGDLADRHRSRATPTATRPTPANRPFQPLPRRVRREAADRVRRPPARRARSGCCCAVPRSRNRRAIGGNEHDREEERQQQRDDHRGRDRPDELAEDAADEQHRREHHDRGERARRAMRSRPGRSRARIDAEPIGPRRGSGSSRLASIDSEITIASSTSRPSVRIRPNSVIVLSV